MNGASKVRSLLWRIRTVSSASAWTWRGGSARWRLDREPWIHCTSTSRGVLSGAAMTSLFREVARDGAQRAAVRASGWKVVRRTGTRLGWDAGGHQYPPDRGLPPH